MFMMQKLLGLAFILISFFAFLLFSAKNTAFAARCGDIGGTCKSSADCTGQGGTINDAGYCPSGMVCCMVSSSTQTSGSSSTNVFQWGGWGNISGGVTLGDFSKILGIGAVKNTPTATWEKILSTAISLLFFASFVIALAFLILGGFNWLTSGGDKQKLANARQHVLFAIIGLVIVFVATLVIRILGSFLGTNLLNIP
jgi:hypothetical protein